MVSRTTISELSYAGAPDNVKVCFDEDVSKLEVERDELQAKNERLKELLYNERNKLINDGVPYYRNKELFDNWLKQALEQKEK